MLKAHNEGISRINRQGINNFTRNGTLRTKENCSEDESNIEMSVSFDDTINLENTANIQNNAKNTKVGLINLGKVLK